MPYAAVEETVKAPVRTPLLSIVQFLLLKADMAPVGISVIMVHEESKGRGARYPEPEKVPKLLGAPLFGVMTKVD
jgi:hypothetical protein